MPATLSTPSRQTVRCILFDLGDTLWTTRTKDRLRPFEEQSAQHALAILHENIASDTLTLSAFMHDFHKAMKGQNAQAKRAHPYLEPDPIRMIQQALVDMGLPQQNKHVCERIYEAYRPVMPETRILFDGVLETLAELKQRGYILGVVTNRSYGGPNFIEGMREMGLLDFFASDAMAISVDLGIRKPNPEIYTYALNKLGVSAQETAMVGDTLNADIAASKKLNIYAVWKPGPWLRARAEFDALSRYAASHPVDASGQVASVEQTDIELAVPLLTNEDVLAFALERNERQHDPFYRPDAIVEHMPDLLDVFDPISR